MFLNFLQYFQNVYPQVLHLNNYRIVHYLQILLHRIKEKRHQMLTTVYEANNISKTYKWNVLILCQVNITTSNHNTCITADILECMYVGTDGFPEQTTDAIYDTKFTQLLSLFLKFHLMCISQQNNTVTLEIWKITLCYMLLFPTSCIIIELSKTISSIPDTKINYQLAVVYESIFLKRN